jgi:sugar phosphate isomerase/epimerase
MEGELPWDTFYSNTNKDVIMQLNLGNALHGGADPLPYLYRYPERAITIHLEEFSKKNDKALIGEGDINWRTVFALCRAVGGTEWYIIEQESYAFSPLECAEKCLQKLREMRMA